MLLAFNGLNFADRPFSIFEYHEPKIFLCNSGGGNFSMRMARSREVRGSVKLLWRCDS